MITLQEAKVGMADKVDQKVVDTFRRSSLLLDKLVFDNAISPGTGGSTLTYGYIQLKTPSTAAVRQINSEYTAGEAKREEKTTKAVVMGGKFQIDRVLIGTAGAVDELAFQTEQKVKATANYFNNLVINGNKSNSGTGVLNTFDGLDKLLTGTETEITSTVDVSTEALMNANYNALLDEVDGFLSTLDGKPSMLLMNNKMLSKMRSAARRAGYYSKTRDEFGRQVETYNDIPMYDMGKYYNGTNTVDIIPETAATSSAEGKTDIYAVTIGLDGFHGVSPTGSKVINSYMPDLSKPGAVKDGEVELVAGVALKNTNKAGVLRGIKISPKTSA
ncbi:MAG: phage capsid protein [Clostridiales bacterium]|uniref:major capsid protein n=1 Tax=Terrisporobacter sp. TaxID=1965305 RepID=UPI002A512D73|nr:phage capsid protein [Terrisporobacter sp.]MDD7754166.1 phage capsid protein [Clostridiales bacterium]MDY4136504.1 phage capsid protein [Terrisporobacter sp.]